MPPTLNSVTKLTERARILINRMLDHRQTPFSIARYICRTTRERISEEAITRYAKPYLAKKQAREDARERADYLVEEMILHGDDVSDLIRGALHETFARARENGDLLKMDPLLLEAADRRRMEFALHRKQVSLNERKVMVVEERLRHDLKKAKAAISKLDRKTRKGKSLTPADVNQIREIYGLHHQADSPNQSRDCEGAPTQ